MNSVPAFFTALAVAGDRARSGGLCVGLVRNTTHTGAIGRYAHALAERGCVVLIAVAGIPLMAYHGARVRSVSTSPLAIGVPTGRGPVVLDMATSVAALGRLVQARAAGDPIPDGWAIATALTKSCCLANAAVAPKPSAARRGSELGPPPGRLSGCWRRSSPSTCRRVCRNGISSAGIDGIAEQLPETHVTCGPWLPLGEHD